MIPAIAFLVLVSSLCAVAAWLADDGLRRLGAPTRGIWLLSLLAPWAFLLMPLWLPAAAWGTGPSSMAPVIELSGITVAGAGAGVALEMVLAGVWAGLSFAMLGVLLVTRRSLVRERGRWAREEVLGRPVYVSPDRGPAVAGTVRPWIVLPRWALALPDLDLGLVMLHEEEHIRARDALLLASALVTVVATPWNPVTWWQLRRLRSAVEMDCDRRVLRREPDTERYGRSLLTVARRASGPSLGLAAFSERPLSLERRIVVMTAKNTRWTPLRATFLVLLALVVGAQACGVENPVESDEPQFSAVELPPPPDGSQSVAASDAGDPRVEESDSWQTPFTNAPVILNREEIADAMQAEYPPLLREAGIGGRVVVFLFVDETGTLQDFRIDQSSGHQALDDAALRVASVFRFEAALNGDEPVATWISLPITFQVS